MVMMFRKKETQPTTNKVPSRVSTGANTAVPRRGQVGGASFPSASGTTFGVPLLNVKEIEMKVNKGPFHSWGTQKHGTEA